MNLPDSRAADIRERRSAVTEAMIEQLPVVRQEIEDIWSTGKTEAVIEVCPHARYLPGGFEAFVNELINWMKTDYKNLYYTTGHESRTPMDFLTVCRTRPA